MFDLKKKYMKQFNLQGDGQYKNFKFYHSNISWDDFLSQY